MSDLDDFKATYFDECSELLLDLEEQFAAIQGGDRSAEEDLAVGIRDHDPGSALDLERRGQLLVPANPEEGLAPLDDDARRERFFDLWTLKEALVKGLGVGMAMFVEPSGMGAGAHMEKTSTRVR